MMPRATRRSKTLGPPTPSSLVLSWSLLIFSGDRLERHPVLDSDIFPISFVIIFLFFSKISRFHAMQPKYHNHVQRSKLLHALFTHIIYMCVFIELSRCSMIVPLNIQVAYLKFCFEILFINNLVDK